jgi:hypothetical protein
MLVDRGKNKAAARVAQLVAGAKKRFTNAKQALPLGSTPVTVGDAMTKMQQVVDKRAAVVTAQAAAKSRVDEEDAALPDLTAFVSAFTTLVRLNFGDDAEALSDFGLAPRKVPEPQTAEQKAVAVAKRAATRVARGTKSAKQKKHIKGNVTAELVVTPVAPAGASVKSEG